MSHEQTRREHASQRDMVVRSLLLAPTAEERSEERVRPRKPKPVPAVIRPSAGHVYTFPTVNGHPL